MNHQVTHESEWLRQLRQKDEAMRREIDADSVAARLTTGLADIQSARRTARVEPGTLGTLVHRLARAAAAGLRRPVGTVARS